MNDLTNTALVITLALIGGMVLTRLRQPAVLGYVLAGIVLGPGGLGLIADASSVHLLAELGVLLLLFLVGMELDVRDFRAQWRVSIGALFGQILISCSIMGVAGILWNVSFQAALVMGFMGALSSTAVAVKLLESMKELHTATGRITLGILIAQDLAFIPMVLITKSFGGDGIEENMLIKLLMAVVFLGILIPLLGRKGRFPLPFATAIRADGDMVPLAALAFCFGLSALSGILGLSAAYGAFIAGLIMGNSTHHTTLIKATHPIQSVLIMVFFLSIGLLLDLNFIVAHWIEVILIVFLVSAVKSIANMTLLHFLKVSWPRAFLSGLTLAQLGEFSFLLATTAAEAHVLSQKAIKMVVAVTALSLTFSPLWVVMGRRLHGLGIRKGISLKDLLKASLEREIVLWESIRVGRKKKDGEREEGS